ncbi:MAG: hypothetical protein DRN27_08970 [Thermoplasmata archaeon]|nr:MAG: hypothetical protein DRN27_08970 [Thermoplasmata archaeon]
MTGKTVLCIFNGEVNMTNEKNRMKRKKEINSFGRLINWGTDSNKFYHLSIKLCTIKKILTHNKYDIGVSQIVGTLLLLIIAVSSLSVIYSTVLSDEGPSPDTFVKIIGKAEGKYVYLEHIGGENIGTEDEISYTIAGVSGLSTIYDLIEDDREPFHVWNLGERLRINISYNISNLNQFQTAEITAVDLLSNSIIFHGPIELPPPASDVGVTMSIEDLNGDPITIGDELLINITVTSYGGDVAGSGEVVVNYLIPEGLQLIGFNSPTGHSEDYSNITGNWNIGNILVNQSATLHIRVQVDETVGKTPTQIALVLDGSGSIADNEWYQTNDDVYSGSYSVKSDYNDEGNFRCNGLNTSDVNDNITVDFWYKKDFNWPSDLVLYYYNGLDWNLVSNFNKINLISAEDGEIDVSDSMIENANFPARRGSSINGWDRWDEASSTQYSNLLFSDNKRYRGRDPGSGDNSAILLEFMCEEDRDSITQINISVELSRRTSDDKFFVYIWNYVTDSYEELGNTNTGNSDYILNSEISTNPKNYLEPGSGNLTIFAVNQDTSEWIQIDDFNIEIITTSPSDGWENFNDIITDSQYFNSNFRIGFRSDLKINGEQIWVDDVSIKKDGNELLDDGFERDLWNWDINWQSDWDMVRFGLANAIRNEEVFPADGANELTIIQFGSSKAVTELSPTHITDSAIANNTADKIINLTQIRSYTPIAAGIYLTTDQLSTSTNFTSDDRQAIVIITDGLPNKCSKRPFSNNPDGPYDAYQYLLNDYFRGSPWNDNWDDTPSNWIFSSSYGYQDSYSAKSSDGNEGDFTSNDINTLPEKEIQIDFRYRLKNTEGNDLELYYYDGSNWDFIKNFDDSANNKWLRYRHTITDSQYLKSNFKIQFRSNLGSSEYVWIDNVRIIPDAKSSAEIARDDSRSFFNMNDENNAMDEIDVLAVGPGPDVSWLNSSIIWPNPYIWDIQEPFSEPGWVVHIDSFDQFELAINEMFMALFSIKNTVNFVSSSTFDPNSNNNHVTVTIK